MLRTSENETEILLGNKQLTGIFFVVAALLGVAFYGGYMVGRAGSSRAEMAAPAAVTDTTSTAKTSTAGGETHSFPTDTNPATDQSAAAPETSTHPAAPPSTVSQPPAEEPLGSPKRKPSPATAPASLTSDSSAAFTPQPGEEFLQVAAVEKDEAEAVADVLQKKGFLAHAVPKPGNAKIYRVLIGPVKDAADLSQTRDALRRTGFREVITQKY